MGNNLQAASDLDSDTATLLRDYQDKRLSMGLSPMPDDEPGEDRFARMLRETRERISSMPQPTADQIAREEARHASKLADEAHGRVLELARQAGERYTTCRLHTFKATTDQQRKVITALCEYIDRPNRGEGLVLYGPCGTGKDHLAFSVAGKEAYDGTEVIWLNGQDWYGQVRDAMDEDVTEASLIYRISRPALAVISDPLPPIGNLTQHQATMLYRVVQARYQAGKPTIVTVNVASDQEADERLGVPTWDRLCDGAWKLFCNWPSFRKPAREVK